MEKLVALKARVVELDAELSADPPTPVRLHPNLPDLYWQKVASLAATLTHPDIRQPALDAIRGLIERVTLRGEGDAMRLELEGALGALIDAAQPGGLRGVDAGSIKVVAGACNRLNLLCDTAA